MSLGGLVDKILVYRSCSHGFNPSYGTSFFFFFDHTHTHVYLACKGLKEYLLTSLMKCSFIFILFVRNLLRSVESWKVLLMTSRKYSTFLMKAKELDQYEHVELDGYATS